MTAVRREVMELTDTRLLLNRLRVAAQSDGANPKSFALLLRKAAESDPPAWHLEGFPSFTAYVLAPIADGGLGMTREQVKIAAALAGTETAGLVGELLRDEVPAALPWERPTTESNKDGGTNNSTVRDRTNTADHITARLKRDDPELAERVVRGEITPNAAAHQKGWRKPRIILSTPERVDESIRKYMPPEARRRLAELLTEEDR